jgi:hypothetical protein
VVTEAPRTGPGFDASDEMMGSVPTASQLRQVARQLRLISELTEELADDSPPDAALRDRLGLAADVLEAAGQKP